jgi:hypothetical protein
MFVKANAGAEDKYYIAGHVFRIISCLNQVLFACNNAYCINEKKIKSKLVCKFLSYHYAYPI